MKLSLLIHIKGPESKNVGLYVCDSDQYTPPNSWWRIGFVQDIKFELSVDDYIPKINAGFSGFHYEEMEDPILEEGIVLFFSDFINIGSRPKVPTMQNVIIYEAQPMPEEKVMHYQKLKEQYYDVEPPLNEILKALGCVQKVKFETSVETMKAKLEITGIKSSAFTIQSDWVGNLPDWVTIHLKDLDNLKEIGTDGVIDRVKDNE